MLQYDINKYCSRINLISTISNKICTTGCLLKFLANCNNAMVNCTGIFFAFCSLKSVLVFTLFVPFKLIAYMHNVPKRRKNITFKVLLYKSFFFLKSFGLLYMCQPNPVFLNQYKDFGNLYVLSKMHISTRIIWHHFAKYFFKFVIILENMFHNSIFFSYHPQFKEQCKGLHIKCNKTKKCVKISGLLIKFLKEESS